MSYDSTNVENNAWEQYDCCRENIKIVLTDIIRYSMWYRSIHWMQCCIVTQARAAQQPLTMCIEKRCRWWRWAIAILVVRTTACCRHCCQFANSCTDQYWVAPLGIISSSNEDAVPWDWYESYEEGGPIENTRQCINYYFHAALQFVAAAGDNGPQQSEHNNILQSWELMAPTERSPRQHRSVDLCSSEWWARVFGKRSANIVAVTHRCELKYHPLILINFYQRE